VITTNGTYPWPIVVVPTIYKRKVEIISFVVKFRSYPILTVNFEVWVKVGSRRICGKLYFKHNRIYTINKNAKHRIIYWKDIIYRGGSRGEGAQPARARLKMEKIWFFGVKSWFFTRNTPKCAPLTWNPGSAPDLFSRTWNYRTGLSSFRSWESFDLCFCYLSLKQWDVDIIFFTHWNNLFST
jgi:hypothetical protein